MDPMPDRILIWGCGGHGKVVADLVRACGFEVAGFVDQDISRLGEVMEPGGARLIAKDEEVESCLRNGAPLPAQAASIAVAVGDNAARMRIVERAAALLAQPLQHPRAVVSPSARLGRGTVVLAGAIVNADARVGDGVILNSGCVVEHDCCIEDGVHVSPGAVLAGGVAVGYRTWIGAGAVVIQQVRVGADVVVGAGAVVVRDVSEGLRVVGVPARPLKMRIP